MNFNNILVFVVTLFLYTNVYSQLDNSFFDLDKYEEKIDSSHLLFHFDNLNYFRNTEYTSLVDKGSTYIGFNLLPYVQYSFNDKAQIYGGVNIRYDFGNPQIQKIEPYFKFTYELWKHDIIFGSINGTVQHKLIEPLYDYELAVTDRFEQGLQIRKPGKVIEYDAWIDWHTMIYEKDPFNEIFFAGVNASLHPINNDKHKLTLNGQALTVHEAGEIDESIYPNSMEYNFAYGLEYTHYINKVTDLFVSGHAAFYEDRSGILATGFRDGLGQYGILRLTHKDYQFVLNYWDGHQFQAPRGEQLFFSLGNRNSPVPFHYRKAVGFRIAYEVEIGENLVFLNRVGVNYNIDHNRADVIMGNYLRWHFTTKKPKKIDIN
jgi:hypothetical protein